MVSEEGRAQMATATSRGPGNRAQCGHGKPPCALYGVFGLVGFAIPAIPMPFRPSRFVLCEFYRFTAYRLRHLLSVLILRSVGLTFTISRAHRFTIYQFTFYRPLVLDISPFASNFGPVGLPFSPFRNAQAVFAVLSIS